MNLLRGSNDFRDAIVEAAARLGVAERQVEKDYWVTETLRELVRRFDGEFLFKGGTSLSKGYRLVERFSEDIDLLLLSEEGDATEGLLDEIQTAAGDVCGSPAEVDQRTKGLARRILVTYPQLQNTPKAPGMRRQIVVEPGVRGGPQPRDRLSIGTLVAQALGPDTAYDDLTAFTIDVLHPARTMVEKLFAVDAIAARLVAEPTRMKTDTEARHFYDLYHLWDEDQSPALSWLSEGDNFVELLANCMEVSRRWFPDNPAEIPSGGFAHSRAFVDGGLTDRIRDGYNRMLVSVCYPNAPRPTFEDICARAAELDGRI